MNTIISTTDRDALDMYGAKDFRCISKDKALKVASDVLSLGKQCELAESGIYQAHDVVNMATSMVNASLDMVKDMTQSEDTISTQSIDLQKAIVTACENELSKEDLDSKDRIEILNTMAHAADTVSKEAECVRNAHKEIRNTVFKVVFGIVLIFGLGTRAYAGFNSYQRHH